MKANPQQPARRSSATGAARRTSGALQGSPFLSLSLSLVPPMSTTTTSITITRKVEYPFTPSEDGLEHSSPINLQTAPFDRGSWRLFYFYDGYQLTYGVRWTGVHGAQAHFAPGTLALDSFVTQQLVTGQLNGAAGEVTGDYYAEDWSLEPTCISLSITEEVPEAAVVRGERVAEGYASECWPWGLAGLG